MRDVWVVESGNYSDRVIDGVFASFGAVKAAYPNEEWRDALEGNGDKEILNWCNGKDWDSALHATAYELQGEVE